MKQESAGAAAGGGGEAGAEAGGSVGGGGAAPGPGAEAGGAPSPAPAWDPSALREDEFERHVVYIVPDLPTAPGCPTRAQSSLPRNLVLKPSQALSDVSHAHPPFGP
ncbi:hypothetical protein R5R35_002204 [Gryllus longicercus]|uniref:Uncharacterized protein n=1 Tax=Gryllus longicercus TaxID=2509291 RepID=A0AAN9VQV7_9ORTH